jgi:K+-sensing histidine kinase KdpD
MLVLTGRHRMVKQGTKPLALHETIMGAIGHIEYYSSVTPSIAPDCVVAPHVVSDLIHLLSELLDNATRHSGLLDPSATVSYEDSLVSGEGVTVVIRDEGFGMSAEQLRIANARVSSVEGLTPDTVQHMGLHVVGRLAIRHGIRVTLHSGPEQGVTARVELPDDLITARTACQLVTAPLPALIDADVGREPVPVDPVSANRRRVTHVKSETHLSLAAQWRRITETWADPPS